VYAVAELNIRRKQACPVIPEGTVSKPDSAPFAAARAERIPFTATAIVTVFAPAVLSTNKSRTVPRTALSSAPSKVPVGSVMAVAAADVEVMYPDFTCPAVAVAVALIACGVFVIIGVSILGCVRVGFNPFGCAICMC